MDFDHILYENDCFLNVSGLFDYGWKDKFKIQATRPGMFYKLIDLYDFWPVKRRLH